MGTFKKEIKSGPVKAALFENVAKRRDGSEVKFVTATISRTYRTEKSETGFAQTNNYSARDLPDLILVAQKAYEYLRLAERDAARPEENQGPVQTVPEDTDSEPEPSEQSMLFRKGRLG